MATATNITLLVCFLACYPVMSLITGFAVALREANRKQGVPSLWALAGLILLPALGWGNYVYVRQMKMTGVAKARRASLILRYMALVHAPIVLVSSVLLALILFRILEHERYIIQHPDPATLDPDGFGQFIDWLVDVLGLLVSTIIFVVIWILYAAGTAYLTCFLPLVIGLSMVGKKVRGHTDVSNQTRMDYWFKP